jgi:predicted RNase H-like nuclease
MDNLLHDIPGARCIFRETHPEICFWAMAGYIPMEHPKKSIAGQEERLEVLQKVYPRSREVVKAALGRFLRKEVAKDDILDALANAVTATRLKEAGATLPEDPPKDRHGLPMEMVYARPTFHSKPDCSKIQENEQRSARIRDK